MKRSVAVALLFLFPLALSAQQINEVIEVNVVEIEVVVLDSHGKPVPGLTKDDFEVREGGKKREITNFYAVDHGEIHYDAPAAPLPATTSAEPPPAPIPAPPLHYVIYVDNAHLDLKQRNRVLDSLRKFINEYPLHGRLWT